MQLDYSLDGHRNLWAQAGFNELLARDGNAAIQSSQVAAIVPEVVYTNLYAALPKLFAQPSTRVSFIRWIHPPRRCCLL